MTHETLFSFTKIIVDDLDRAADFYKATMGFREYQRVKDDVAGEAMEEIILIHGEQMGESVPLIVWKFPQRKAPVDSDSILGFQTRDVDALLTRIVAAGGSAVQAPKSNPAHGVRVAFAQDPDGRLLELVQML